jgi:Nif-specific regulatory protein
MSSNIHEITALYQISRTLLAQTDLKTAGQMVMDILVKSFGMTRGTLSLYDDQTGELAIEVALGMTPDEIRRGRYKIGEGVTGKVFESGEPMAIPNVSKEPLFLDKTRSRGDLSRKNIAFLCVPVKIQKDTIGVLSVDRISEGDGTKLEDEIRILKEVAELIGLAAKAARAETETKRSLMETNLYLHRELKHRFKLRNVIGISKQMQEVFVLVEQVSLSKATVLIRGETGTGKELIAHAIHFKSPRAEQPFIKFSCVAVPETLLESELFGHEKGAFTGAIRTKPGRFELAHGGTLFLDEIGDVSLAIQTKLLRVIQERKFERVGGTRTFSADIRIIVATNKNLEQAVKEKTFREDLYYRLNVIPIQISPLRERKEDILPLVEHFLAKFNADNGKEIVISPSALSIFQQYDWPGNVRELENVVERLVVMARNEIIYPEEMHIPISGVSSSAVPGISPAVSQSKTGSLSKTVGDIEKEQILEALRRTGGVQARAARLLGITTRQIRYKINKYGIVIDTIV